MEIQGMHNEDKSEIRIIVKCDNEIEFQAFHHFFEKMIENMVTEAGATAVDTTEGKVFGTIEGREEEIHKIMHKQAESMAINANQGHRKEMRINFL